MNVHINSMILCLDLAYFLYAETDFGMQYDTQLVWLELWGRCISYVCQQIVYHMHAKHCI